MRVEDLRTERRSSPLVVTFTALLLALTTVSCDTADPEPPSSPGTTPIVVDTDMGSDDVMALLYLLERRDVRIAAVTVAGDGLAHCDAGVRNARAVLALAGSPGTPVACGRPSPLAGHNTFPEEWRTYSDDLSRILGLPAPAGAGTTATPSISSLSRSTGSRRSSRRGR